MNRGAAALGPATGRHTNGDGAADFWIRLDGLHTLTSGDYVL